MNVPWNRRSTVRIHLARPVVLFDLDGTLVDSAPDLSAAANEMLASRSLPEKPVASYRAMAGAGARGILGVAFGVTPGDAEFGPLRDEFFVRYERGIARQSTVFPEVECVLRQLDAQGMRWGVVTNKATRLTMLLLDSLQLSVRAAVVVCGDTVARAKPHADPYREAARRLNIDARHCVCVGDDLRDVQAAHAAGMVTVAARWGYLGNGLPIEQWNADHIISSPSELMGILTCMA